MRLCESRKLSKNKAHYVDAIIQREDKADGIPKPYPNAHRPVIEDVMRGVECPSGGEAPPSEDTAAAAA